MRKKAKNRPQNAASEVSNVAPSGASPSVKQKLLDFIEKIQQFLLTLPLVIAMLRLRDGISEKLRLLILAFFDCLSPCWTFLFVKTPKQKKTTILIEMKNIIIPNPFSDEPTDNGPTSSKSNG